MTESVFWIGAGTALVSLLLLVWFPWFFILVLVGVVIMLVGEMIS